MGLLPSDPDKSFIVVQLTTRLTVCMKESLVYHIIKSSFENLLEKDGTVSMHVKNLQKLATEMFSLPLISETIPSES